MSGTCRDGIAIRLHNEGCKVCRIRTRLAKHSMMLPYILHLSLRSCEYLTMMFRGFRPRGGGAWGLVEAALRSRVGRHACLIATLMSRMLQSKGVCAAARDDT